MDTKLVAYLTLDGTAAAAMRFYQTVFGGELTLQTFAEAKMADPAEPYANWIIHAQLTAPGFTLMASDRHPTHSPAVVTGNSVNLSLIGSDEELLSGYFTKLADGGRIEMPLETQFWGDRFGSCVDRYGVPWMVNITSVATLS